MGEKYGIEKVKYRIVSLRFNIYRKLTELLPLREGILLFIDKFLKAYGALFNKIRSLRDRQYR